MLNFGNKEFRNLQEQVFKNMKDIQNMMQGITVLADFGIKVVGKVNTAEELPNPADYVLEGAYGDAYIVGTEEPYDYYIFTRAFEGQEEPSWFNIGKFPVPGPKGDKGDKGDPGIPASVTVGSVTTQTLDAGLNASVNVTDTGVGNARIFNFSFEIPQGIQGIQGVQGIQGIQGPQGIQGIQGEKGDAGNLYTILGKYSSASDLPSPYNTSRTGAYLVGTTPPYDVYVIIGTNNNLEWINLGPIATISSSTHVLTLNYATSGTAAQATLTDILNESGSHFVQVGDHVFCFAYKYDNYNLYYAVGNNGVDVEVGQLLLNTNVGNWKISTTDLASTIGDYPTMKVGSAKQLENLSTNSGSIQTDPFLFQGTGTRNNTAETSTAPIAKQLELRGNSVVVNQILQDLQSINLINHSTDILLHGVTDSGVINTSHKYLIYIKVNSMNGDGTIRLRYPILKNLTIGDNYVLVDTPNNTSIMLQYFSNDGNTTTISLPENYAKCIDLTQWFGSNEAIPEYLLSNPEAFLNYYQGSLEYNPGEIVSCQSSKLITKGLNQWDEEWEVGSFDSEGNPIQQNILLRSKNFIRIISNTNYYFRSSGNNWFVIYFYDSKKNFISSVERNNNYALTPENAMYMKFRMDTSYGTTYKNDICISLYWDGERTNYEPYVKHEYQLPDIVLRSAGNAYDEITPDGKLTRRIGRVDLGTLNWSRMEFPKGEGIYLFYTNNPTQNSNTTNYNCSKYEVEKEGLPLYTDKCITGKGGIGNSIWIRDDSYTDTATFKNAMSGVYLYYELETPTTSDVSPFAENIEVDDYGTMEFVCDTGVPQGNKFFYPADYVKLIDDLNTYTNGDVNSLAKISNVQSEASSRESNDNILKDAIGGTLRQCLCVKESLDFDNTDFVDLGTINFDTSATNTSGVYRFTSTNLVGLAKGSSANNTIAKCLCTKIKTNSIDNTYLCQDGISISPSGSLSIFVQGINDSTSIKTYLEGQLLAYEKA